jgi:hypothetical protein
MRVRLTLDPDGRIALESPYDAQFVEDLKSVIMRGAREWVPERRRWLISALYTEELLRLLGQVGADVRDDRPPAAAVVAPPPMPPRLRHAFDTLFLAYNAPLYVAEVVYKNLAKLYHPDTGGTPEHFHAIHDAIATIRRYLGPTPPAEPDDDDAGIPF